MIIEMRNYDNFRDMFNDMSEIFFIEKNDRVELYSYIRELPALFKFSLLREKIKTDYDTFINHLRDSSVEAVDVK